MPRPRPRRLAVGLLAVWELLPAALALAGAGLFAWAGAPVKVWGFALLVSLGLAVVGWLGIGFWTRARYPRG